MDAFSTNVVTKPEELFGRRDFIDNIIASIHGMNNCAIIGARRFGKTCVLKRIKSELENDRTIFPVLVDSRDVGNSNLDTSDVYRCLVAMIIEELYNAGVFTQKETFDLTKEIIPWEEWGVIYQQVRKYDETDIKTLFKSVVKFFAKKMNKTILLIIDEYEYLLTRSMKPEGFNVIRNLTQQPLNAQALMPIKYLICGAKNWQVFQKEIDSGVLNETGVTVFLPPISEKDFKDMWRFETSKNNISQVTKLKLMQRIDWAYEKSGGVPFYGKIIGNFICRENSLPDYSELRPFFHELLNNQFNSRQVSILLELLNGNKPKELTDNLIELVKEGVIVRDETDSYKLCIGFLKDYLKANYSEVKNRITDNTTDVDEFANLVDEIFVTIKKINSARRAKNLGYIFHPSDSDDTQTCMKSKCKTDGDLGLFFKHVYITYAERTSNYKDGQRIDGTYGRSLPGDFNSNDHFYGAIGVLRHFYTHSDFKEKKNQMTISDALTFFIESQKIPVNSEECAELQLKVLRRMLDVIEGLLDYVNKEDEA